jgi:VWFA-related protein
VLCVVGVATLGAPIRGQKPVPPQFRASTDVVTIDVAVMRGNRPVTGLTTSDFELLDNGVPQSIAVASTEGVPLDVTLVVDQTGFTQVQVGNRLAADLSKAASMLRAADRLRVITFAGDVRELLSLQPWSRWPDDPAPDDALERMLKAEWSNESSKDLRLHPKFRRWSLFDALLMALAKPAELGRRHLIVGISMGVDTHSVFSDSKLFPAISARTDALMYAILGRDRIATNQPRQVTLGGGPIGGRVLEPLHGRYARMVIQAAAETTGGEVREFDPVGAFRVVLEGYRKSYLLQYTLSGVPLKGWHDVVVRTPKFPTYKVRARKRYFGG